MEDVEQIRKVIKDSGTKPRQQPLSPAEETFLLDRNNLEDQYHLSLPNRCRLFNEKFGCNKMNYSRLRALYKAHDVKKRKLVYNVKLSEKQLDK